MGFLWYTHSHHRFNSFLNCILVLNRVVDLALDQSQTLIFRSVDTICGFVSQNVKKGIGDKSATLLDNNLLQGPSLQHHVFLTAYFWFHSVQLQPVVARKWSCSEKVYTLIAWRYHFNKKRSIPSTSSFQATF